MRSNDWKTLYVNLKAKWKNFNLKCIQCHCGWSSYPRPCHVSSHWEAREWQHDDVRGIHRSPVNSPHKGPRRGTLMFTLICAPISGWVNNHEASDLRRHRAHYDATVMKTYQVIVKFAIRDVWKRVYSAKKDSKIDRTTDVNLGHVFINKDLTQFGVNLTREARVIKIWFNQ